MSRYGIDYYGVSRYGSSTLVEFNVQPFYTLPENYGKIDIFWTAPSGTNWSAFRLVRNSYGFPVDADDGDVLVEATPLVKPVYYEDDGLIQGRTYYYSIFVQESTNLVWLRAGNAYGVSVKDFDSYNKMYRYLPQIHRAVDIYELTSDKENKDLQDFLKLLAFEYDLEKTYATNIMYSYDTTFVDGRYIPQMMKQFGLKFEPEIGLKQSRILLRNAMKIYKNKGSKDGLTTYLKAYTGYDTTITVGKNLFLDYNCSSFEEGIGFWAGTSATLSRNTVIAAYAEPTAPAAFPNLQAGILKAVVTTAGTVTLSCGLSAPITRGIPVSPALPYTFSIYGQASSTARTATLTIKWYDRFGTLISTSSAGTGVSITSTGWSRVKVTATSPALAAFAVPVISLASTTLSEIFYFDAGQFEQASDATAFEEARILKINFLASRINEITNPNFQGTTGWSGLNASLVSSSAVPGAPAKVGQSLIVRPGSGAPVTVKSENIISITGGATHTFSVYADYFNEGADPTVSDAVFAVVRWYNSSDVLLQTDTGTLIAHSGTSGWVRPSVTSTAPATATYAVASIGWYPSSTGVSLVLDEALFEQSAFVNSYFDGNTGVASLTDLFWEGTANASKSQYYRNRATTEGRLLTDLPNYLTAGTTFQLYFGQP